MSDERIEQIERELRAPGPRESAGRGRPLPSDVREARRLLSQIDGRRNAGRVVMRAGAVGLAAAAAVAVAVAIGATRPGNLPAGGSSTSPSPTAFTTPTPAASQGPVACAASDLRAVSDRWGAAAGSRGTSVHITLVSGPDCVLQGSPGARIIDSSGAVVIVSFDPGNRPEHPWMNLSDPPITMSVGGPQTTMSVTWSNWCAAPPADLRLELRITTDGPHLPVTAAAGDTIPVPPCNGGGEPSSLGTNLFGS